jgi:ribonuclease P protein component
MSVSKKVGNAVIRNSVRRRLREAFRATRPALLGSQDVVISARPAAAEATYEALENEFQRSLERLNKNQPSKKV